VRASVRTADLDGAACFGVLPKVPLKLRPLPSGYAHEFAYIGSLIGGLAQSEPERILRFWVRVVVVWNVGRGTIAMVNIQVSRHV